MGLFFSTSAYGHALCPPGPLSTRWACTLGMHSVHQVGMHSVHQVGMHSVHQVLCPPGGHALCPPGGHALCPPGALSTRCVQHFHERFNCTAANLPPRAPAALQAHPIPLPLLASRCPQYGLHLQMDSPSGTKHPYILASLNPPFARPCLIIWTTFQAHLTLTPYQAPFQCCSSFCLAPQPTQKRPRPPPAPLAGPLGCFPLTTLLASYLHRHLTTCLCYPHDP